MIKRAGENISATEGETAMREAPLIAEPAAIAVTDEPRRKEVMVLIKLAEGAGQADMPPEAVRFHAEALAAFKRPRYKAYVQDFPRTATNNIAKSRIVPETVDGEIWDCQTGAVLPPSDIARLLAGKG